MNWMCFDNTFCQTRQTGIYSYLVVKDFHFSNLPCLIRNYAE